MSGKLGTATAYTGTHLDRVRRALGWTRPELARRMGISRAYIWLVLHGKRPITTTIVERAVAATHMPEDLLFFAAPSTIVDRPVDMVDEREEAAS